MVHTGRRIYQGHEIMDVSLKSIPRDKVLFALMLAAVCGLLLLTNFMLERHPERDTQMLGMATLQGRGGLPSLHTAMNHDGDLTAMVQGLSSIPAEDIFVNHTAVDQDIVLILFRWAGADALPSNRDGPYIDSRVVAFLRKVGAVPESIPEGTTITAEQAGQLTDTWFRAFDHYRLRLLAQTHGKKIYQGGIAYNAGQDSLHAAGNLDPDFMKALGAGLGRSNNSGEVVRGFLDFVEQTKGFTNLSDQDQDMIMGLDIRPSQERVAPPQSAPQPQAEQPPAGDLSVSAP